MKYDIAVMVVDRRSVNIVEKRDPNPIPLTDSLPALFWPQDKFALFRVLPFPGKTRVLNCQMSICQISDLVKILNIVYSIVNPCFLLLSSHHRMCEIWAIMGRIEV